MTLRPAFRALAVLHLGVVVPWGAGCGDLPCREDGTCEGGVLRCDFLTNTCRPPCLSDEECGMGQICVSPTGVCRPGQRSPDAGAAGQGQTGTDCPEGQEGCVCYSNGSCDFGSLCRGSLCERAVGEADQPCFPNATCSAGLECVERAEGDVCRRPGQGSIGEACFSRVPLGDGLRCRSATARCEDDLICAGGVGDACGSGAPCQRRLTCEDGACASSEVSDAGAAEPADAAAPPDAGWAGGPDAGLAPSDLGLAFDAGAPCLFRSECGVGQFCCGEPGTHYADPSRCRETGGTFASSGECFDAPSEIYERPCAIHEDCNPAPELSPAESGASLCVPWSGVAGQCSAPCDATDMDPACPNGWSCAPGFASCFSSADCGGLGLDCVGANPILGRPGRCRCGGSGEPLLSCTSTVAGAEGPGGTCAPDGPGDFFCKLTDHCVPPPP